jgi:hypothetical protein
MKTNKQRTDLCSSPGEKRRGRILAHFGRPHKFQHGTRDSPRKHPRYVWNRRLQKRSPWLRLVQLLLSRSRTSLWRFETSSHESTDESRRCPTTSSDSRTNSDYHQARGVRHGTKGEHHDYHPKLWVRYPCSEGGAVES